MSVNSDIRNALTTLIRQVNGGMDSFTAEVLSVDIPTRTCAVLSISTKVETEYPGVWLMPQVDDGLLYIPTVGSTVVVANNVNMQPYIAMWSAIDKVLYVSGGSTFQVDSDGLKLDGDEFGGIPKVIEITEKLNNLENVVNKLVDNWNSFASAYVPGSPSITGLPANLTTPPFTTPSDLTPTQQSDIENLKVKHGAG